MTDHPLIAFYGARLDEDQAAAFACIRGMERSAFQKNGTLPPRWLAEQGTSGIRSEDGILRVQHTWADERQHIIRHDPSRALRDIAAKRAILASHTPIESIYGLVCKRCVSWQDAPWAEGGETEFGIAIPDLWPCLPVRGGLASWSDHPDYDPTWAPED